MKTKNVVVKLLLIVGLIFIVNTSFLADNKLDFVYVETETEESLIIEDWMKNENLFEKETKESFKNNFEISIETETEESLVIEDWMKNENNFNVNYIEVEDDKLQIENWMLDEKNFQ